MEHVQIRDCTHQDLDAIVQLDTQWAQENITHDFIHSSREAVMAYLERTPMYFLVAESDAGIVGYINGSVHLNEGVAVLPNQEPYLEIDNLYVQAHCRARGIGSQLMDSLLTRAQQNGVQRFIVASVSTDMDKIIAFYRRHGFHLWYVQFFQ